MIAHWLSVTDLSQALIAVWFAVMTLLGLFGIHRYGLARTARRALPPDRSAPPAPCLPEELPIVTVQLPVFNERYVVERLLRSVAALEWPRERLEIQLLDDSTDETTSIAAAEVERLRELGHDVVHLRRRERTGFKAGALAHGLARAKGTLIAIFDADFVPRPDFLRLSVPWLGDPQVGLVQARWGHLNRDHSLLTQVQALMLDGHFLIEHTARAARGSFFNFNGTAGVWRKAAIEDAGGWQADTLTEDLDLSYRAQLRGWRFVFRPEIEAPAELPTDFNSFKSQQHRWARGSAQSAVKLLPRLWRSPLPWRIRIAATFHLVGNFAYALLLLLALLAWPAIELRYRTDLTQTLLVDLPFFVLTTLSLAAFYETPLRRAASGPVRWRLLPALMALGIGMSVNNTRAVLSGLLSPAGEFIRTPKSGGAGSGGFLRGRWRGWGRGRDPGYAANRSLWLVVEGALALWFCWLLVHAFQERLWPSLPFLALFASGFAATAIGSLSGPRAACDAAPANQQILPETSS